MLGHGSGKSDPSCDVVDRCLPRGFGSRRWPSRHDERYAARFQSVGCYRARLELEQNACPGYFDGSMVGQARLSPTIQWLLDNGYAYGGISRSPVGYDFPKAVDDLIAVRELFSAQHGTPSRTIAWGASRGAFVGRLCLELHPDVFDAAIVMAGGGAGEIGVLNSKLDSLFTLKTLVNPTSPDSRDKRSRSYQVPGPAIP